MKWRLWVVLAASGVHADSASSNAYCSTDLTAVSTMTCTSSIINIIIISSLPHLICFSISTSLYLFLHLHIIISSLSHLILSSSAHSISNGPGIGPHKHLLLKLTVE
ncbi:hypothetical protein KP509_03G052800 [Ceratopteris richardii]|uniref:Secreted protein n=1 Tax=Ceratopteris richardii TaxID=49495 RepID=A0A8T2UZU7_CERRI|nr:hypothetical protein KP509_03G052800 [Ceratopteris richardii]